jgi:hypothetical protein
VGASEVGSTLPRRCCLHTSLAFLVSPRLGRVGALRSVWGCGGHVPERLCSEFGVCRVHSLLPHVQDWRSLREVAVDLGSEPVFFHRDEVGVQGC